MIDSFVGRSVVGMQPPVLVLATVRVNKFGSELGIAKKRKFLMVKNFLKRFQSRIGCV